jgi:hypothetical protein
MRYRVFLLFTVLIGFWYAVPPVVSAVQSATGKLQGTVVDPSGAVITNATVTAVREASEPIVTLTNDAGRFVFPSLTPGRYTVTMEAENFKKLILSEVIIEVGGAVTRDVALEPGKITEEVVVTATDQPVVEVGKGPAIGAVVDARQVLDLPLNGRNPLDLIQLQGSVVFNNVSGTRTTSNNIRVDGIQAQDNYIQELINNSFVPTSVDDVAEFRVTTSPVDVEFSRGGGVQVDVVTRAGTNEFHGSVWEFHRNTAFNANTFFNNAISRNADGTEVSPREVLLRHQFGFRLGGPVLKNRTFFFTAYEGFRESSGESITRTVLTATARRGLFRYFTDANGGFPNGNAASNEPTVDEQGNPRPPSSTAVMQQVNLFTLALPAGATGSRSTPDQTGLLRLLLDSTPLPNNFRAGDGLNTAGFAFFAPVRTVSDQLTIRVDHAFSDKHRLYGTYRLGDDSFIGSVAPGQFQTFPGFGLGGQTSRGQSFSGSLVSSFTPTFINEFRAGFQRRPIFFNPAEEGGLAAVGGKLPTLQGVPIRLSVGSFSNPIDNFEFQRRVAPLFQYGDTVTWVRGNHEWRGGGEVRFIQVNEILTFGLLPAVSLGEAPDTQAEFPTGPNSPAPPFPTDQDLARRILYDLTGSIAGASQTYRTPDGQTLLPFQSDGNGLRHRQLSLFLRDQWRVRPNVMLIYGTRYEYFTVPYQVNRLLVQPTLGAGHTRFEAALGISNRTGTYADLFQPNAPATDPAAVGPVGFELLGPGHAHQLFRDDYNNFAPVVGISWSPAFKLWGLRHLFGGQNQSVIRGGYAISYEAFPLVLFSQFSRNNPGQSANATFSPDGIVSRLDNPTGLRLPAPLDDTRALQSPTYEGRGISSGWFIDENLRSPYVQNWNLSWQRELTKDTILELRYIGTKGTKLIRASNINEINIIENGLRREFDLVRQQLLASGNPLTFRPSQFPAGVDVLRRIFRTPTNFLNTFGQRNNLLRGDYVQIAFAMDRSSFQGQFGGRVAAGGLPVNFISANPQFASVLYMSNYSNSTYHAAQVEVRRRFAQGLAFQANYTFSRALGDGTDDGGNQFAFSTNFRTNRNRSLEKGRLVFDREHVVKINGIYELPLGPGKRFLNGTNQILGKVLQGWELTGIFQSYSGRPRTFSSGRFTLFGAGGFNVIPPNPTPGFDIRQFHGEVTRLPNGVTFFPGLTNPFADQFGLNRQVVDANGNVILITPEPGTAGTLGVGTISDPGEVFFDASVIKRTQVTERLNLEFRAEIFNVFNNVNFTFNPLTGGGGFNANIQATNFGRLEFQSNDPRIIQFALRVSF